MPGEDPEREAVYVKFSDRVREEVNNHTSMGFAFYMVVFCPLLILFWGLIGVLEGRC